MSREGEGYDYRNEVKVSTLIALCHDGHQELLLQEEEKLQVPYVTLNGTSGRTKIGIFILF